MTSIDRLGFLTSHLLSRKQACRVATTANISLEGIQVIDGVTVEADDRVLVKDQTNPIFNGVYLAKTGEWELADDFDQRGHVVDGTRIFVVHGTVNALTDWYVTTTGRPWPGREAISFALSTQTLDADLTAIAALSRARGDIIRGGASAWERLALGTTGYTLKSDGTDVVWAPSREILTADRTYYVATTGSDSANGLTALTPFATVAKAFTTIRDTLDLAFYNVTIQLADGTYTEHIVARGHWFGGGEGETSGSKIFLQGNLASPANVIISTTGTNAIAVIFRSWLTIQGMEIRTTTSGHALDAGSYGRINVGPSVRFGTVAAGYSHMNADSWGHIKVLDDYAIVGGADTHWLSFDHGLIEVSGRTVTLSGTPAFASAFALAIRAGHIDAIGNTYSGSATGPRFIVRGAGSIWTNGAGLTALPGNSAGVFNSGFYDDQVGVATAQAAVVQGGDAASSSLTLKSTSGAGTTDTIVFKTGNDVERARISTGVMTIWGLATPGTPLFNDVTLQLHGDAGSSNNVLSAIYWADSNVQPRQNFYKSRGTSAGSHVVVQVDDFVGSLDFQGSDGSAFQRGAAIRANVDGTPGAADMPMRLSFWTSPDGSATIAERMRIANGGNTYFPGVGTTASAANAFLNSGSTPANELLRSTSSARYKRDVEDLDASYADALLDLRPVWYRSVAKADRPDWSWYGLIAEEVANVDPRLVHWGYAPEDWEAVEVGEGDEVHTTRRLKEGAQLKPDGVTYDRLTVLLLSIVQRQQAAIADLQKQVAALQPAA